MEPPSDPVELARWHPPGGWAGPDELARVLSALQDLPTGEIVSDDAEDHPKHAYCPSCGQTCHARPGEQVPIHTEPGNPNKRCPGGTGQ